MESKDFENAIIACFKKYAVFSGRSTRLEYWSFTFFQILANIILSLVPVLGNVLSSILVLACYIPSLAVSFRRLHDTGRSGLWHFAPFLGVVGFIPFIVLLAASGFDVEDESFYMEHIPALLFMLAGFLAIMVLGIVVFVFLVSPSAVGTNKYGPNPFGEEKARPDSQIKESGVSLEKTPEIHHIDSEELIKLKKLLDDGIITQEDFDKKKKELLGLQI